MSSSSSASRASVLARPFADNPLWADVKPISQDEGEQQHQMPVVPINYPAHYSDVMDLFRGVLRLNELSPRTLLLTEAVIDCNSANYSAWHYRRLCLAATQADLRAELTWVATVAMDTPKNYQLWHHRRCLLEKLADLSSELATSELRLTEDVLEMDAKNYHAWSHRQWCIKFFTRGLTPTPATADSAPAASGSAAASSAGGAASSPRPNASILDLELSYIDRLLQVDIRNNSAWNQRFFIRTLPPVSEPLPTTAATEPTFTTGMTADTITEEIRYAGGKLIQAAHNESAWNYLEGLMKQREFQHHREVMDVLRSLPEYPAEVTPAEATTEELTSSTDYSSSAFDGLSLLANRFAQSLLVELWDSLGASAQPRARRAAEWLAGELDQVRRKYWLWRAEKMGGERKEADAK